MVKTNVAGRSPPAAPHQFRGQLSSLVFRYFFPQPSMYIATLVRLEDMEEIPERILQKNESPTKNTLPRALSTLHGRVGAHLGLAAHSARQLA